MLCGILAALVVLTLVISFATGRKSKVSLKVSSHDPTIVAEMSKVRPLPGQQSWKNGVSSYIFGTTDTGEWGIPNIEFSDSKVAPGTPNHVAQNIVKQAGFSLMRKFVGHYDIYKKEKNDLALKAISDTMINTGTQCFINLSSIDLSDSSRKTGDQYTDLQFAQHVVTLLDGHHPGYIKCSMFEIGNEPDLDELDPDMYASVWNKFASTLKALRPDARFIGPVLSRYNADYMQHFLQSIVQNHYLVPDAIAWHYYPCGSSKHVNWSDCLLQSIPNDNPLAQAADVRAKMQSILGYQLPIGISEWSTDASGILPTKEPEMSQFIVQTLNHMIQAKLSFANEFDMQSYAGYGRFDMLDQQNRPRPYFNAFANVIKTHKP
jgi:hypothetical protein